MPVYNRVDKVINFISLLKNQTFNNWHLILVDDGSNDGTSEKALELISEITILKGDGNLWWGGSLELAINHLHQLKIDNDDFVLMINDDTEFSNDFLLNGIKFLEKKEKSLLLAQGKDQKGNIFESGIKINWPFMKFSTPQKGQEIECAPTRGLLFKYKDLIQIGNFIPKKLPHYCSDYEFTYRATRKGLKIETDKDFFLYVDTETTGLHFIKASSLKEYFEKAFSMRSAKNPLTLSKFVQVSCPIYLKPFAYFRIWLGFSIRLIQSFFQRAT